MYNIGSSIKSVKNSDEAKSKIVLEAFFGPFSLAEHSVSFQFWCG